jgi:hypothetical protein
MRILVIGLLIAILFSMGSALVFIYRDRGDNKLRVVKALTLRVGLSVALFLLLMGGHYLGLVSYPL